MKALLENLLFRWRCSLTRVRLLIGWHMLWCDWCGNAHLGRWCEERVELEMDHNDFVAEAERREARGTIASPHDSQ